MSIAASEFGLLPSGQVQTSAFQSALDRLGAAGGGELVLPPGRYVTGTLHWRSRVSLRLEAGAELTASTNIRDFPPVGPLLSGHGNKDLQPHHFLLFDDVENVALQGEGVIDGSGAAFWQPELTSYGWHLEKDARPSPMLLFHNARGVRIRGLRIQNSPGWTLSLHGCRDVVVDGVTIVNSRIGPNTDGLDILDSSLVRVTNCSLDCGDDGIVLKSLGGVCEDVVVSNCVVRTNCRAYKLGAKEAHGTIRRVVFSGCTARDSTNGICLINAGGGVFEDVVYQGLCLECCTDTPFVPAVHVDCHGRGGPPGVIRRVHLRDIIIRSDRRLLITSEKRGRVSDILMSGVSVFMPSIEIPGEAARRAVSEQFSPATPWAREQSALVVAENIDNLRLLDWTVRTATPPPPGFAFASWANSSVSFRDIVSDLPLAQD